MRKTLFVLMLMGALLVPAASHAQIARTLMIGSRGEDVASLQRILSTLGYFKHEATGYFGMITSAAVSSFQAANGLEAVGFVGPKTRALVNVLLAPMTPLPPPTPEATTTSTSIEPASAATSSPETLPTIAENVPPQITVVTPPVLPTDTRETALSITTDKSATCRFGTTPAMEFSRKTSFKNTGGMNHSHDFINLRNGGLYIYYVQCEDVKTLYLSNETMISFTVAERSSSAPVMPQVAAAASSVASIRLWTIIAPMKTFLRTLGI